MSEIGGSTGEGTSRARKVAMRSMPPAFLTKTYRIVDDPNTDSIVKWGKFGDSFVILDYIRFSAEVLPKYFTHNNFSSFVYQLNNYGFRKIGVDHQWEYMNSNFQAGKQHLLSNMRRRSEQQPTLQRGRRNKSSSLNPEMLMNAINESRVEMNKLKVQQVDMDFHIMELQEEAKNAAEASKKLTMLFAKTCEIIAKRGREDDDDDEGVIKRKKVVEPERAESPTMNNDTDLYLDAPLSEVQLVSSEDDHAFKSKPETIPENYSNDVKIWEMILLGDDEDGEVGVTKNDQD